MCGRYEISSSVEAWVRTYVTTFHASELQSEEIAPTDGVGVLILSGEDIVCRSMRWGFIPEWMDTKPKRGGFINARSETVFEKPSFQRAARSRRCLLPASAFFEWAQGEGGKVPHRLSLPDEAGFTMGGVWETWRDPKGEMYDTVAILTVEANASVAIIHDRMPLLLHERVHRTWLDPSTSERSVRNLMTRRMPALRLELLTEMPRQRERSARTPRQGELPF